MEKTKLLTAFLILFMGLLMVLVPEACLRVIVTFIGLLLISDSIFTLSKILPVLDDIIVKRIVRGRAIFCIILGLATALLPLFFIKVIGGISSLLLYVLALLLFLCAILETVTLFNIKSSDNKRYYIGKIIVSLVLAAVLCFLSRNLMNKITIIFGVLFIIVGALYLITIVKNKPIVLTPESVKDIEESNTENT